MEIIEVTRILLKQQHDAVVTLPYLGEIYNELARLYAIEEHARNLLNLLQSDEHTGPNNDHHLMVNLRRALGEG